MTSCCGLPRVLAGIACTVQQVVDSESLVFLFRREDEMRALATASEAKAYQSITHGENCEDFRELGMLTGVAE